MRRSGWTALHVNMHPLCLLFLYTLTCVFLMVSALLYERKGSAFVGVFFLSIYKIFSMHLGKFWKTKHFCLFHLFLPTRISSKQTCLVIHYLVGTFICLSRFLSMGASGGFFVVLRMACFSSCFLCRSRPSNLLALIYIICHWKLFIATMAGILLASVFWSQA